MPQTLLPAKRKKEQSAKKTPWTDIAQSINVSGTGSQGIAMNTKMKGGHCLHNLQDENKLKCTSHKK